MSSSIKNMEGAASVLLYDILSCDARRVTRHMAPNVVIRATRRLYRGRIDKRREEIIVTIGKPNYREREYIKTLKKAREPLPVGKVQYKFLKGKKK